MVGRFNLPANEVAKRRIAARIEVEHLIWFIESEPMGVRIGLIEETLPNTTFQLFRTPERTLLGLIPFRMGDELPNIWTGIAMPTSDEEPVRLYEQLVTNLWRGAYKGCVRLPEWQTPEALFRSLGGRGGPGSAGHGFDPQQRFELFAREKLLFKDDVGDLSFPHKGGGELEHETT